MKKIIYALIFSALSFSSIAQTTYVTVSGAGLQNGSSWTNAMNGSMLRDLVRTAPTTSTAQIWVAAGTYYPHPTSRDSSFNMAAQVKIYGGFAGNETLLSQRNWTTNVTTLSGDIGIANNSTDNSYNIVSYMNAYDNILDGFTITGGNADHPFQFQQEFGGGILNLCGGTGFATSDPLIKNCRLLDNNAIESGGAIANLSMQGTAHLIVEDCYFEDNTATENAGAIYSYGNFVTDQFSQPGNSDITVRNSIFLHNTVPSGNTFGGAISIVNGGGTNNTTITGCHFEDNFASAGGAICNYTYPAYTKYLAVLNLTIDSSSFVNNNTDGSGIAIMSMPSYSNTSNMTISHTNFEDNNYSFSAGQVIRTLHNANNKTNTNIIGCKFINNFWGNDGNVIYGTGTPSTDNLVAGVDTLLISNSFFYNNGRGNDIYRESTDGVKLVTIMSNSTVYHDSLTSLQITGITNRAGYISTANPLTEASLYVYNSILWHRLPWWGLMFQDEIHNDVFGNGIPPSAAHGYVSNSIVTGYNTSWPTDYGTNGGSNSGLYPMFVDTPNMDFHLQCASFGINHGNNSKIIPANITTDVVGGVRIHNTTVDIGAYETIVGIPQVIPTVSVNGWDLTYSHNLIGQADSVHWTFGDGGTSITNTGIHSYTQVGTFTICVYVENDCGSSDSCFTVTVPNTTTVSTMEQTQQLVLYPNPATDNVSIAGLQQAAQLTVYNSVGQKILTASLQPGNNNISLNRLSTGAYIFELRSADGDVKRARLVKQ